MSPKKAYSYKTLKDGGGFYVRIEVRSEKKEERRAKREERWKQRDER